MRLEFGKYRGRDITDVPDDYIEFMIISSEKTARLFHEEQDRRLAQREAKLSAMERIIQAGYRTLALQNHPDKGGNTAAMQEINFAHDRLKSIIRGMQ